MMIPIIPGFRLDPTGKWYILKIWGNIYIAPNQFQLQPNNAIIKRENSNGL